MAINDYVVALHEAKDHAFLTDYFRWWVLREYGGIYLDADVEIIRGSELNELVEELQVAESFDAFIGIDNRAGGWYTAHSMASKPGSAIARFMCAVYEGMGPLRAWRKRAFYLWAPQLTALYFADNGHNIDGMGTTANIDFPVVAARVKVYPQDYFSPMAPETAEDGNLFSINALTERSILCHHFACSWHDDKSPYAAHAKSFEGTRNRLLKDLIARSDISVQRNLVGEMISSADRARDSGRWKEAEDFYVQSLSLDQTLDHIWVQLGHAQKEQGKFYEAEFAYRRATFLNATNADTFLQLGHLLKIAGHPEEARSLYERAIALDPSNTEAARELEQSAADIPRKATRKRWQMFKG